MFLPDFWMKLVKPSHTLLPNQVQFVVSSQMTKLDVKQYLEKIYNLPVIHVSTYNRMGKTTLMPNNSSFETVEKLMNYLLLKVKQKLHQTDM